MPNSPNHPYEPRKPTVSRRRFGRNAVLAGAFTFSSAGLLAGEKRTPGSGSTAPDSLGLESERAQEVEAKLSNIIRKYGDRLSFAQREHLRRILAYNEKMLASVWSFSLQNGDPPASVLRISFSDRSARHESPGDVKKKQSSSLDKTQRETS